ncbi:chromatin remodelling complex Rsc7/Swp82 subunit-domain-containing protein [Blastocladiella britannica]|nr:chromatin remodelling complex Rsc7/Swp82 subunit-domain-containing protein [Blastocladiella britannica]
MLGLDSSLTSLRKGRKYRVSSFLLPERHPRRRYMFAPEVARHVGARDGFILFQKYPQLTRITTTIPEREMLIAQGHMAAHLKGRNIALITARTAFRHFGHKVVRGGRPIRDDYWVGDLEYVATGNTDDDESEFENQVLGAKPKERDHRDLLAAQTAVAIARSAEAAAIADREATAAAAELVHSSLLGVANRFAPVGVEDHGRNLSALALARSVADLDTFAAEHALARLSVTDISSPSTSSRVAEAVARARAEANVPSTAIAPESWMYQAALSAAAYNSKLNAFSRPRARVLEPLTGIWMVPANRNPEGPIKVQARIGGAAAPAHVPCTLDRDIGFPALEAVADAPVSQQHQWTSRMHVGRSSTSTTTTMVATLPNTPTSEDLMRQFPLAVAPGQAQAALALPRFIETPVAMVTTAVGPVPGVHTVSTGSAPASLSRRTVPASAVAPEGVTSVVLGTVGTDDDLRGLRGYNAGVSVGPAWAAAAAIATRSLSLLAPANYHQLTSSRRGGGAGSSHHSLSAIGAPGLDYKALGDKDPRGQHRCAGITPTADRCQRLVRLRGIYYLHYFVVPFPYLVYSRRILPVPSPPAKPDGRRTCGQASPVAQPGGVCRSGRPRSDCHQRAQHSARRRRGTTRERYGGWGRR